jgi:hypothetical protein
MISVFQIFKIIMGIIISAFILTLVLQFSGSYMQIGESSRQVSIVANLKKTVEDVYTTGIATDFEMRDSEVLGYNAPYIQTEVTDIQLEPIPLIITAGQKFSVSRLEYDLGWWKFYFVEALPDTKILFMPEDEQKEDVWNALRNMTMFLPSTENVKTKVRFGIGCDGSDIYCCSERYVFSENVVPAVRGLEVDMEVCENSGYFKEEGYKLITISEGIVEGDFVVVPDEGGVGNVHFKEYGEYEDYIYKNGLDIAALALGGTTLYDYMNKKYLSEMEAAIKIVTMELEIMMNDYNLQRRCGSEIPAFTYKLNKIKEIIPLIDSENEESAKKFAGYVAESVSIYRELEMMGCT